MSSEHCHERKDDESRLENTEKSFASSLYYLLDEYLDKFGDAKKMEFWKKKSDLNTVISVLQKFFLVGQAMTVQVMESEEGIEQNLGNETENKPTEHDWGKRMQESGEDYSAPFNSYDYERYCSSNEAISELSKSLEAVKRNLSNSTETVRQMEIVVNHLLPELTKNRDCLAALVEKETYLEDLLSQMRIYSEDTTTNGDRVTQESFVVLPGSDLDLTKPLSKEWKWTRRVFLNIEEKEEMEIEIAKDEDFERTEGGKDGRRIQNELHVSIHVQESEESNIPGNQETPEGDIFDRIQAGVESQAISDKKYAAGDKTDNTRQISKSLERSATDQMDIIGVSLNSEDNRCVMDNDSAEVSDLWAKIFESKSLVKRNAMAVQSSQKIEDNSEVNIAGQEIQKVEDSTAVEKQILELPQKSADGILTEERKDESLETRNSEKLKKQNRKSHSSPVAKRTRSRTNNQKPSCD